MADPMINPGKFFKEMLEGAQKHLPLNQYFEGKIALVFAIFGLAAGLFQIAAAITFLAEVIAKKK